MAPEPQPKTPEPRARLDPDRVETWIFDLDNTLYPASCNLFAQVDRRMCAFIQELLGLGEKEARRLQKRYFRDYGTTLRGLMEHQGVAPERFLDFVHHIDFSPVPAAPGLDAALGALAGRKLVFTNATVAYSGRVLERLGVGHHMEAIFDIEAAGYRPKPEPESYRRLIERHHIDPARAVLVEDMARNLAPAAELGMTTVWVTHEAAWSSEGARADCIDHVTDDLADWLGQVTGASAKR